MKIKFASDVAIESVESIYIIENIFNKIQSNKNLIVGEKIIHMDSCIIFYEIFKDYILITKIE